MTIAKEIAQQIGGKALFMLGAKNLVGEPSALSFRVGKSSCENGAVNHVKITLTPLDLYNVEFGYIRGNKYTIKKTDEGIYADMLPSSLESGTGRYVSM